MDDDDLDDFEQAAGELIMEAMKISRRYQVCAVCLLNDSAEGAFKAIECGELIHGIPGIDYNIDTEDHPQ